MNYAVVSTKRNGQVYIFEYESPSPAYDHFNKVCRSKEWTTQLIRGYGYKWASVEATK